MKNINNICKKINELLSPYIDGELSDVEKSLVENHLQECDSCQANLESLKQLSLNLKKSLTLDENKIPDLSSLVMSAIEKHNITCDNVLEDLSSYFDGELEPAAYYSIDNHLESCTDCNDKYKKLEYLRGLIKLSIDSLDIDMWESVYNRLKKLEPLECTFVSDQLSAYLDKEIDLSLSRDIAEHILACETCRKQFEDLKIIQKKVQLALIKPSKDINLWPNIYSKLIKANRSKTFMYSSVASIFTVFLVWTVLSISFPVNGQYTTELTSNNNSNNNKFWKDNLASVLASENNNTSDDYLFSKVFDESAGGIIPIVYNEGDYGY